MKEIIFRKGEKIKCIKEFIAPNKRILLIKGDYYLVKKDYYDDENWIIIDDIYQFDIAYHIDLFEKISQELQENSLSEKHKTSFKDLLNSCATVRIGYFVEGDIVKIKKYLIDDVTFSIEEIGPSNNIRLKQLWYSPDYFEKVAMEEILE